MPQFAQLKKCIFSNSRNNTRQNTKCGSASNIKTTEVYLISKVESNKLPFQSNNLKVWDSLQFSFFQEKWSKMLERQLGNKKNISIVS